MNNPRTIALLARFLRIMRGKRIPFAIGGGIAVNVHGYERETKDVDAFFRNEDRYRVLRTMREAGFEIDDPYSPYIYFAFPPNAKSVRYRVDLMFPQDDPEISAVEMPERVRRWGLTFPVFSAELLALTKFVSERPGDRRDFLKLYELGGFDVKEARRLLRHIDRDRLALFDELTERSR